MLIAEAAHVRRISALAAEVLKVMQQPNHGYYDAERTLRQWLTDNGVTYSSADLVLALQLLQSRGDLIRARSSKRSHPRAGWVPNTPQAQVPSYSSLTVKKVL
jgi:hypothetical protein